MADIDNGNKGAWAAAVGTFLWANKEWIWARVREIRSWFGKGEGTPTSPGILILGPGGTGKSTLARMLSEDHNYQLDLPGEYKESVGLETYSLSDALGVEIVVPPGQHQRRAATWADLYSDLAAGKFRGVILVAANGHHSFMLSYKQHRLYDGDKDSFVENLCLEQRAEELAVLRELAPHMVTTQGKLWMLTLVTKQDLWWPKHIEVEKHYLDGGYAAEIQRIGAKRGGREFRHEFVFVSLVISNFLTGAREQLKPNAAGYDTTLQVESLRRLFETVDALRQWEAGS